MHEALSIATPLESTSTPVRWLEVEAVAARLGVSVRRVRQLAAETWLAQRLAKLERSDGYRPRWLIADAADPRLASVHFPDAMASDVEKLSDDQRRIALQKKQILDGWMSARAAGYRQNKTERQITAAYVLQVQADHAMRIARKTLFAWQKLYRLDGLNGLMDGRWKQARAADPGGEDEFFKLFDRLYLNLRAPTAKSSWDAACMIAAERGIEARSYKQTLRHAEKIPLAVRVKCREGEKAYVDKIAPYTQRDYSQLAVNEWWIPITIVVT